MLARLRAGALHDRVGVSRSRAGVEDPRCNIVHIERPANARLRDQGRSAARSWLSAAEGDADQRRQQHQHARASAVLRVGRAREDARERLVPEWMKLQHPELAEAIAADADELARMVARTTTSGEGDAASTAAGSVSARLEALSWQPCPRWHADTVGARGLVTYAGSGGGTQYLANARVSRGWAADGVPFVAGVRPPRQPDEAPFEAAGLGDILLLKGHACPGMMGMGAVHRSPPMEEGEEEGEEHEEGAPRLVLTVDDALPCDCCPPDQAGALLPDEGRRREGAAAVR
jgi:hypothetical protein